MSGIWQFKVDESLHEHAALISIILLYNLLKNEESIDNLNKKIPNITIFTAKREWTYCTYTLSFYVYG